MVLVADVGPGGVEVHQLLCGRDVAAGSDAIFQMASQMANYIYVVVAEADDGCRSAVVIDGCWDVDGILRLCKEELKVDRVSAAAYTHHHFDHTGGKLPRSMTRGQHIELQGLATFAAQGIDVAVGVKDLPTVAKQSGIEASAIRALEEGDKVSLNKDVALHVLQTPGHTAGSVCLKLQGPDTAEAPVLFTGDTLFIGSCGRHDLPDSDLRAMLASLDRLSRLPAETVVLPGHNYAAPAHTTIGAEKSTNDMMVQAMGLVKSGRIAPSAVAGALPLPDYLGVAQRIAALFEADARPESDNLDAMENDDCCCGHAHEALPFFEDMAMHVSKV